MSGSEVVPKSGGEVPDLLSAIAKKNHNRAPLEGSEPTRKLVCPKGFPKVGPGDCEHFC